MLSLPAQRARDPSLWERIRWAFGWVRPGDLQQRSDAELLALAERWAKGGHAARATRVLQAFAARATRDPRVLQQYGDISRNLGAHDAAIASYLGAADLYLADGVINKAAALLSQLVRVYPDQLEAQLGLARSYEAMGRGKEAAIAYANASHLLEARGDAASAGALMARATELAPFGRRSSAPPPPRSGLSALPLEHAPRPSASPSPFPSPVAPPARISEPAPARPSAPAAAAPAAPLQDEDPLDIDLGSIMLAPTDIPTAETSAPRLEDAPDTIFMMPAIDLPSETVDARPRIDEPVDPRPILGLHASLRYAGDAPTRMYSEVDAAPTMMDLRAVSRPIPAQSSLIVDLADIPGHDTEPESDLEDPALLRRRRSW